CSASSSKYPDTTGISILPYDILGNVRIWDGDGNGSAIIDMGAYEFDAPVWVGITDPPINEIDSKMITTLYPNPCSGTFHIKFILPVNESVSCEVYSISGQKVWQKNVCSQGANILKIDLSDFPSGIYLLQISSNSNTDRAKIILK
ncbi:MAG: T9SS type A sorting domain-containing protein, partial [Bacteroidota bacterium]